MQFNQREACSRSACFVNAHHVLMMPGASLERQAVGNLNVRMAVVIAASQALQRHRGRSYWLAVLAAYDIPVPVERLLVESEYFVLPIGGLVVGDFDAKLPFAESHMDIGGLVSFLVGCDGRARIHGKAQVGGARVAGAHVESSNRRIDPHVLVAAVRVFVYLDAATCG